MRTAHATAALLLSFSGAGFCATHVVKVEGMAFHPARVVVHRGDAVVWDNRDPVPHTATARGAFDSGQIAPGQRWRWRASRKGSLDYLCTDHPGMTGTVVVE